MYLNKAIIIGNITRDIELKALPSGIKVASFSVATNRVWKDKAGTRQESADYHNVVVFGRQAETVAQYMKKGSQVLIEGRMQTRSWDNKDTGAKNYRTEIIADHVQFGNNNPNKSSTSTPDRSNRVSTDAEDRKYDKDADAGDELDTLEYPDEQINAEDIPF